MAVVIEQKHLSLNTRLAKLSNRLRKSFNYKTYSKIENIDSLLLNRDISVEKKKSILIEKLYNLIVSTFSINKNKLDKKTFELFKKRLQNIRKIIHKLRSINYHLETSFLEELKLSRIKINETGSKLKQRNTIAKGELEALEYTAYKLIEEVVMLDKKLLEEYKQKEKKVLKKEKIEASGINLILKKESELLEHLEAKIPTEKATNMNLLKEPTFTHWVARLFSLLSYLQHMYSKEVTIFNKLKKNKTVRNKINKKIINLVREKSRLLQIMEEKAISMEKLRIEEDFNRELHNLTTTINL